MRLSVKNDWAEQVVDGLKGRLRNLHICLIIGILCTLISLPLAFEMDSIGVFFLITAVGWLPTWWAYSWLKQNYKNTVIEPLFKQLESSSGLRYSQRGKFDKDDFNLLMSFESATFCTSEDFISGTVNGIDFECCEVNAKKLVVQRSWIRFSRIFKGEIYTIKMKEPLKADVFISPDFAEAKLGGLGRFLQKMGQASSDQKVVRMDNPEFEQLFKVISDDDVGTRYFLTPRFMERFVDAQYQNLGQFYLETQGDTIYLMIKDALNKFQPQLTASKIKIGIYRDIELIKTTLGIIESLNLDLHHINVNAKKSDADYA